MYTENAGHLFVAGYTIQLNNFYRSFTRRYRKWMIIFIWVGTSWKILSPVIPPVEKHCFRPLLNNEHFHSNVNKSLVRVFSSRLSHVRANRQRLHRVWKMAIGLADVKIHLLGIYQRMDGQDQSTSTPNILKFSSQLASPWLCRKKAMKNVACVLNWWLWVGLRPCGRMALTICAFESERDGERARPTIHISLKHSQDDAIGLFEKCIFYSSFIRRK